MEKKYFIVTCHGWSASNWVAHSLNLHPDVICSHSARNVLANDKDLQSNDNLKAHLAALHNGYVSRQEKDINDNYDEIERYGKAIYYGSVHLYRLRDLPVVNEKYGPFKRHFTVMNLVRHPVSLVWSGYGQFKDLFLYDINELHWTLGKILNESRDFILGIGRKYELNLGDFENLAFIGAACVLGSLRKDLDALVDVKKNPKIDFKGFMQMEEMTTHQAAFQKNVSTLLPGVDISETYLSEVFATGTINKHKHDTKQISPAERYATFSDWQKEVFLFYFQKYKLRSDYEGLGYDFSFLTY